MFEMLLLILIHSSYAGWLDPEKLQTFSDKIIALKAAAPCHKKSW
jgi:hypothetical protein